MTDDWHEIESLFRYNEHTKEYKKVTIAELEGSIILKAKEGIKGGEAKEISIRLDKNELARLCLVFFQLSLLSVKL